MLGLSSRDLLMPVAPLFRANGRSTAYAAPLVGAGMATPGRDLSPPHTATGKLSKLELRRRLEADGVRATE